MEKVLDRKGVIEEIEMEVDHDGNEIVEDNGMEAGMESDLT